MGLSVVIPVGPRPDHARYLDECLESVAKQSRRPDDVVLVDDMHGLPLKASAYPALRGIPTRIWRSPWRLGVAHAFNFGVALASNYAVFMLGADDTLDHRCLERAEREYLRNREEDHYYFVGVRYMDTGEQQTVPCGAALVTKGLWRRTGGFAPETASGASDAAFISMLMVNGRNLGVDLKPVADGHPLYNYRRSETSDSAERASWQGVILATRDLLTSQFKAPEWGRK